MQTEKIQIKLFTREPDVPLEPFVEVFHRWIKDETLEDEVLVDVADYSHVANGPGILLTGHGSDYYLDQGEGRPGLLYSRKRGAPPPAERLADAFRRTFRAARLLEREARLPTGFGFRTDELLFRIPDRLVARNDEETRGRFQPELTRLLDRMYAGSAFDVARYGTAKQPFTLRVVATGAPDLDTLFDRLA
jgi:hypothetical protein